MKLWSVIAVVSDHSYTRYKIIGIYDSEHAAREAREDFMEEASRRHDWLIIQKTNLNETSDFYREES